jgi:hypothetical protein
VEKRPSLFGAVFRIFLKNSNLLAVNQKLDVFIDPRLEVKWVPEVNGRGVFAKEDIPVNTVIERAPILHIPQRIINMGYWFCQAEGIPSESFVIDQYMIDWGNDIAGMPLGWAGIYNHSDNNNSRLSEWDSVDRSVVGVITIRDIQAGEQVTVTYGETFFRQKGYVKKVDF